MANTAKILAALNKDDVNSVVDINEPSARQDLKESTSPVSSPNMANLVESIGRSFDPRKGDFDLTPGS